MGKADPIPANTLPIAISMGEPAGIGPELILEIYERKNELNLPPFTLVGDPDYLQHLAKLLGKNIDVKATDIENADNLFEDALPILPLSGSIKGSPNKPSPEDGKLICEAISTGVDLAISGHVAALVTAPINKNELYKTGFNFPGHTEYLAHLAQSHFGQSYHPVMMLCGPDLRAIPVTIHIPLKEVPVKLTKELIVETGVILNTDLKDRFGFEKPRIAVAGINPHASENGSIGTEDIDIVGPAIDALQAMGIAANGPFPADTLFHPRAREGYDAVMCMYHDQALIPAKTLAFDDSVNVTLGLPFIRTSPDHGTAYDIAGKGIAKPNSMVAAIKLAHEMSTTQKSSN